MAAAEQKEEKIDLFSSIKLGSIELSNRIAMAPMTRGRATDKFVPTDIMATYYKLRADAGLLITEGTGISPQGLGWYKAPGIWNDEMVKEWKKVTDAVHKANGVIFCQLWHMGRQAHSHVTGVESVSASAIGLDSMVTTVKDERKKYEVPKALSIKEVEDVVKDFGIAAENAMKAGFDGVEIHGANGYLVDQFLQSITNKREDKYGGTIDKRLTFMKEVVNEVISKIPNKDSRRVGIRLSPNSSFAGMGSEDNTELFDAAIEWLSKNTKLGYIHVMYGPNCGFHGKCKEKYTCIRANKIIKNNDKDMLLIGNINYTKESGNDAVVNNELDIVAYGKPFISNPDLVYRFKNNCKLTDVAEHTYWWGWKHDAKGYVDWKTALEEQADADKAGAADDKAAK